MLTTLTQSLSLADVCNTNGCSKHEVQYQLCYDTLLRLEIT